MKNATTFAQGLILAVIMCAIAFGVVALKYRHPALLAQLDRDHLPGFAFAVAGVCLAFATVWTLLNWRKA